MKVRERVEELMEFLDEYHTIRAVVTLALTVTVPFVLCSFLLGRMLEYNFSELDSDLQGVSSRLDDIETELKDIEFEIKNISR